MFGICYTIALKIIYPFYTITGNDWSNPQSILPEFLHIVTGHHKVVREYLFPP